MKVIGVIVPQVVHYYFMSVLSGIDASATAIYGSRGSNGVIIITTKKGRSGQKPQVSYNGTVSVSTIGKKLDVMNASEYVDFIKNYYGEGSSAYQGLGWKEYNADGTPNYAAGTYDTDWQDEIYRAAGTTKKIN